MKTFSFPERKEQIKNLSQLREILGKDVQRCLTILQQGNLSSEDEQFWGRTFVRTMFAMIEALIYTMKQTALAAHFHGDSIFSPIELSFLNEESYELEKTGKVNIREGYATLPFLHNFRFAFKAFARACDSDFELNVGDSVKWGAFREAIEIRNRITHPKSQEDITISSEEINTTIQAFTWFLENFATLQQIATENGNQHIEQFERHQQLRENFIQLKENTQRLLAQDMSHATDIELLKDTCHYFQDIGSSLLEYVDLLLTINDRSVDTIGELINKLGKKAQSYQQALTEHEAKNR